MTDANLLLGYLNPAYFAEPAWLSLTQAHSDSRFYVGGKTDLITQRLLDILEDLDDVQDVFHNAEIAA